ncbi:helix-turn-helix domain-containing protein [Bacillus toyonensis]|uniref:helix-turn-helix domain-containing protein n=1 Tax=Bacillus toyonensis TaxID=155322 RepID=UPI003466FBC2
MAKLCVTTKYELIPHDLLQEKRKIKDPFLKQRLTAIRLIMEGNSATSTSRILGMCRQSISTYIHTFNSDEVDGLLEIHYSPVRTQYLSPVEEVRHMLTSSTPAE